MSMCCAGARPVRLINHLLRSILLIVLVIPKRDRVAERREATRGEILEAAWQLAQEHGLVEFTLRDLAERVGMRAPSLYTHFASKNAIYDAMFGQAWSDYEQIALTELAELPQSPRAAIRRVARVFFDFATAIIGGLINQQLANDPGGTRWSVLLDRTIDVWADGLGLPSDPPAESRRATQPRRPRRQTPATR